MTIFLLVATGPYSGLEGTGTIVGRHAFRSRAAAEGDRERFKALCCNTGRFNDLAEDTAVIHVVEVELEDDPRPGG